MNVDNPLNMRGIEFSKFASQNNEYMIEIFM